MKNLYAIIILCCFGISTNAQTAASYTFTQDNGTYTPLSGATNIYSGSWDDNVTNGLSIGFTFVHCGTSYTTYNICANGWLNFGSSITNTYTPISTKTHVVSPLGNDLYYSPSGTVSYLLSGSAPNRVLTIQWSNVCHFSSSTTGPLNFQVNLYETSNIIEFVYGSFSPSSTTAYSPQVGINGASTSDYNNRTTTTNWAATTAGTANSSTCRQSNSIKPTSGLIFKWCPPAPAITGSSTVCVGAITTLANPLTGGTWSSSNTSIATVGSGTGIVTGVSGGTVNISYTPQCGSAAVKTMTILSAPSASSGSSTVCTGTTTTLTNSSGSGTWSSTSTAVATVGSSSGVVTGVASGVTNIIFTLSSTGCSTTKVMTTNPSPAAVTGTFSACIGDATILSNSTSGGTWSSSNTSLATVGSSTGIVSGITAGIPVISYTLPTGCSSTADVTINPLPAAITGSATVCGSLTEPLSNSSIGGTWSSSNIVVADIGSISGIVTGGSAGSATITYTLPTGCITTYAMSVHPFSSITGTPSVCMGYSTTLSNATTGGTWSSSNTAVATVSGGVVTSVSLGTTAISYSISSTGCTDVVTVAVTNPPSPYTVSGGGSYCDGGTGVHVGLSGSDAGIVYQLYNGVTPVGSPIIGTGGSIDFGLQVLSGPYGVIANPGTACSSIMPGTATISINPLPTAFSVAGGGSYCAGGSGVHVYVSLSEIGVDYQLYNGTTSVGVAMPGTTGAIDFGLHTTTGTYTIVGTNTTTGCIDTMSGSAVISTNPLPNTFNVTGGGGYCTGGTGVHVGLSGSVSGISYQLLLGGVISGSVVTGTGSPIDFGLKTAAGVYTVVATNPSTGCTAPMLLSATVVINPLPTAFTVTGGGNYCSGGTGVHVGLNGSTTGVNYQLYNGSSLVGSPMPGTGTTLDFGLFTTTGTYTVLATNATTGCIDNMTGSATIGINPLPTVFSVTGGGNYCAGGAGVVVGLSGSVTGTNYNLFVGSTLTGAASGTGAALNFGLKTVAGSYTVTAVILATGCTANMSGSASISINPLPVNTYSVTGGGNYCAGGTGLVTGLSGSQTGISYQLFESGTPSGSAVSGTGSAISFGLRTTPGTYTVVGTNTSTTCQNTMTGSKTISIDPLPLVHVVTGGGSYCAGGTGLHIGLSGSNTGIQYQLYNGTSVSGSPVTGSGSVLDFGFRTAAGPYTVVATNTATTCTNTMGGTATIFINPLPTPYSVTGGGNYCAGGTGVHIGLDNSTPGTNYQLYLGSSATGTPVAGTGSAIDFGLKTTAGVYTVVATNPATSCSNTMTGSAIVAVNVLPNAYSVTGGGNYCAGGPGVHIGLNTSNTGINYQLYNGTITVGAPAPGTGTAIDFGLHTASGTYTVVATNPGTTCTRNMTGSAIININPLPASYAVTGGGGYCAGGTGVNVGLSSSSTGISYQLLRGGIYTGSTLTGAGAPLNFGLHTTSGTYTILATNTGTSCAQPMSGSAVVTAHPLPGIHHVTGGGSYCAGGSGVHISLDGSNTGINYQVYNGSSATGSPIAGTGSLLDLGSYTAAGTYHVVATSPSTGCTANMLSTATVSVNTPPASYTITGGGNYCIGGTGMHIGLTGSNPGISYQLYNGTSLSGTPVAGTGGPIDFGLRTATGSYTAVATNITTSCTANMTGSTTIGTSPLPVTYNVSGGGAYCAGGTGRHISLVGSEAGAYYQLYFGTTPIGSPVVGTGIALDMGAMTAAGAYTVVATSAGSSCTNIMTGSASISIDPLPTLHLVTGGGSYCMGGIGLPVGLDVSDPGINYQLFNGTTPAGSVLGGTGADLDMGIQTAPGVYNIVATDPSTGCQANMTGTAGISINPLPALYVAMGGGAYCAGGLGTLIGLSGSDAGTNYQLYNGTSATGSPIPGTGSVISFGLQTAGGIYTVVATNSTSGCTNNMTGTAVVAINALPASYIVTGGGNICSGSTTGVHIGLAGSEFGIIYELYRGGTATGTLLAGTGGALDFGEQTIAGSYSVVASNPSTSCNANMTGAVTIGINALPTTFIVTGGGSYCSGGIGVHIGLSSSTAGILYQLHNGGGPVGSPVTGTGSGIDLGAQTAPGTYTIIATNPVSTCTSSMLGGATVVANSLPSLYIVSGGGSLCSGEPGVSIGLGGSDNDVNYQLYQGTLPVGAPMHGTGFPLDFGPQTTAGTYTIKAINSLTSCSNSMAGTAAVVVNPLPVAYLLTGGGDFCAGGSGVHVGINGSATGITYQLYNGSATVGIPLPGTGGTLDFGLQSVAGIYTVKATNASTGCSRNMTGTSSVVINPLPTAYALTGGGSYCAGGTGVHIGLGNSAAGVQYQLYRSSSAAGAPVTGTGSAIDFGMQTLAGTYTAIAINTTTSCGANMSGSASVSVTPSVSTSVTIATTASDTICAGTPSSFTAVSVNEGLSPSYLWTVNGITRGTGNALTYVPSDGDIVSINMTSSIACAVPSVASNTKTLIVHANQYPVVDVTMNPGAVVCQGTTVSYTAVPYFGGTAPSYTWIKNGTTVSTAVNYSYIPADGDVVSCMMTSNYHCRLANTATSSLVHMDVVVPVNPTVQIIAYPGLNIGAGQATSFTASVANGGFSPSFQWLINGTPVPGATAATFETNSLVNGDVVSCDVTASGPCTGLLGSKSVTVHVYGVGFQQIAPSGLVTVSPNPNKGTFTLKGSFGTAGEVYAEVTDLLGHTVYTEMIPLHNGTMDHKIQLSHIANGMYLLNMRSQGESKVFHIVVEQ